MSTQHLCSKHPSQAGAWVEGGVDACAYHVKAGKPNFKPGIARLMRENRSGISSRDIERSVIAEAKKQGRELGRPADFPHSTPPSTPLKAQR